MLLLLAFLLQYFPKTCQYSIHKSFYMEVMMLKGAQKRMYVVKLGQESPFEEAYFVLKRECDAVEGKDMVSEATRIILQSAGQERAHVPDKKRSWQIALGFVCGFVTGGGIAAAICLLV